MYVATHGCVIMALMSLFAGSIEEFLSFRVLNLHGYAATVDQTTWKRHRRFLAYAAYSALDEGV